MAAMPEKYERLSKVSPYKERMPGIVRSEWRKLLILGFLK